MWHSGVLLRTSESALSQNPCRRYTRSHLEPRRLLPLFLCCLFQGLLCALNSIRTSVHLQVFFAFHILVKTKHVGGALMSRVDFIASRSTRNKQTCNGTKPGGVDLRTGTPRIAHAGTSGRLVLLVCAYSQNQAHIHVFKCGLDYDCRHRGEGLEPTDSERGEQWTAAYCSWVNVSGLRTSVPGKAPVGTPLTKVITPAQTVMS